MGDIGLGGVVLLGGLGGGGDSGGALPFAFELNRLGVTTVFAGFVNARVGDVRGAEHITGALMRVYSSTVSPSTRFFEPSIAFLGYETYCICCKEPRPMVLEAVNWLIRKYRVKTLIYVDMGGDSLVFGDEPLVGSWKEDMAALSILAETAEKNNVKAYLAVGVLGGEGGGKSLSQPHLAENISWLLRDKAYYGYYEPGKHTLRNLLQILPILLKKTPSPMLTLYLDALRGIQGTREYHILYLQGKYHVKQYYKYHFLFNPITVCKKSLFCQYMKKNWRKNTRTNTIRKKIRRTPPIKLETIINKLLEKKIDLKTIIDKHNTKNSSH